MDLTNSQIMQLRKTSRYRRWLDQYGRLELFFRKYHRVPRSREEFPARNKLGRWYTDGNRASYQKGRLKLWQVNLLKKFAYDFHPIDRWEANFRVLRDGWQEHPDSWPYVYFYTLHRQRIEKWCKDQRQYLANGTLSKEKIVRLNSINFVWQPPGDVSWQRHFETIADWIRTNNRLPGRTSEDATERSYMRWIDKERSKANLGQIAGDRATKIVKLCRLAQYNPLRYRWEDSFSMYSNWYAGKGRRPISRSTNEHERRLGRWLENQKKYLKSGQLPMEKARKLRQLISTIT